jgi:LysM repeat protein
LQGKPRMVRCRHCGKKGSSQLTICPHCGRTLQAAPSRLLTVGLPVVLTALALVLLAFQNDSGNPLGWGAVQARAVAGWVSDFSAGLDPQLEILPAPDNNAVAALPTAPIGQPPAELLAEANEAPADGESLAMTNTMIVTAGEPVAGLDISAVISATAAAEATAAVESVAQAAVATPDAAATPNAQSSAPAAAVTVAATPTSFPTATETPLPTATPAPTNTPAPISYTVVRGDAAQAIAARFGISLDALLLANNLSEAEATLLQPGQTLVIPLPSAASGDDNGATTGSLYTVRQGDTLIGIAAQTGVAMELIQAANGLSNAQAAQLQPGDSLVIPGPTAAPTVQATATPSPTNTAQPTATALPSATATTSATRTPTAASTAPPTVAATLSSAMRLPAPQLRGPVDGATIACDAGRLQWQPITGMAADDSYRVHLGFVNGRDTAGNVQISWLIQQDIPATITQVGIPADFCDKSSDAMGNQWRWYVEAVATSGGVTVPVSPTSSVWGFTWKD